MTIGAGCCGPLPVLQAAVVPIFFEVPSRYVSVSAHSFCSILPVLPFFFHYFPTVSLNLQFFMHDFSQTHNCYFFLGLASCEINISLHTAGSLTPHSRQSLHTITINYKDSRWVGAWWLGFLITGVVMLLAGIPFWFLPKSLPKQGESEAEKNSNAQEGEQDTFIPDNNKQSFKPAEVSMRALAKDFLPSLKELFSNSIYILLICTSFVQINGFIGMITFKPKFMEQIYGQSASRAIFLIGIMNLPAVALGIITGGFVMKRFKINVLGAAKMAIVSSVCAFCSLLVQYFLQCDNSQVAGLTVSYQGTPQVSYQQNTLISQCNSGCSCSLKHWDPICASNDMTYASPCLSGCQTSTGFGKDMVFHNCTCIGESPLTYANMSAVLGQCPRKADCDFMFKIYMAVTVVGAFVSACGATPSYIILLRSIKPELKSLALGIQTLTVRTLGGIPPPIYFGALIDRTCLKWGSKRCGGQGACRIYDSVAFRNTFLGLIYGLYTLSYLLWGVLYNRLSHRQKKLDLKNQLNQDGTAVATNGSENAPSAIVKCSENPDQETTI
ncbi:putative solute carrier organic anion transporter family member 1C1-like [Triplophysa rosa]|uniref:Solute carrier organic anion transporter family member n=1 Tax=Triplophysa rosa TaxID=992332 RepID=A0A9W7TJK6_TRIRA|nr:putative solute carrier organic anion transporter family member 1C1-like [Triplophysa rosa]